jgi:hypothetical protein
VTCSAANVNLLGDKRDTINRNMKPLTDASKEVGSECREKSNIKTGNTASENVAQSKYFETTIKVKLSLCVTN